MFDPILRGPTIIPEIPSEIKEIAGENIENIDIEESVEDIIDTIEDVGGDIVDTIEDFFDDVFDF